jgi:hypothetical protein
VNRSRLLAADEPGAYKKSLMRYSREDVSKHRSRDLGGAAWATYKLGVYELDTLAMSHPGGLRLYAAAGNNLEYWFEKFKVHKAPELLEMMEKNYRIGNLKDEKEEARNPADPYYNEPLRNDRKYFCYPRWR